jgi:tRNA modification GTPase
LACEQYSHHWSADVYQQADQGLTGAGMYFEDTIAAIATPLGCGGIGIIRLSGPSAEDIGVKIFKRIKGGGFQSHRLLYGHFIDPVSGASIDEGMAVLMSAPHSYTREHVVELHAHGGYLVVNRILQCCVALGARLAEPGEFTKRAFLNGRIDLCQAESVIDVINSRSDASLALAQRQSSGLLSTAIMSIKQQILEALALVEAHIDFPEEDISPDALHVISSRIASASEQTKALVDSFKVGKVLREGVSVLLAGKPNAGKSSLLNTLACEERAIVSSVPGTTRDLIEEIVNIDGVPVRIIDAAGIRKHHFDDIEREGIRRTMDKLSSADLVLFIVDGTQDFDQDDQDILDSLSGKEFIVVITKSDLHNDQPQPAFLADLDPVLISSRTLDGIDLLRKRIFDFFMSGTSGFSDELICLSNARHHTSLKKVLAHLGSFVSGCALQFSPELLSVDLRDALSSLGEITGETTTDDVLDLIFSSFCIGK